MHGSITQGVVVLQTKGSGFTGGKFRVFSLGSALANKRAHGDFKISTEVISFEP